MTLYPAIAAASQPYRKHLPRWVVRRVSPIMVEEGEEHALSLSVNNANIGSCIMIWFTGGSSMASSGSWEQSWHTVFETALIENGCSYLRLSGSTTPKASGTLAGLITIGEEYRGQTIRFTNRSRRNRRTNATNPDGTPGYREMQVLLTNQGASGTAARELNGTGVISGGNLLRLLDTSRTPIGTPKLALKLLDAKGNPSPVTVQEGSTIGVRIVTENIRTGTKLKMYPADLGRKALSPSFRTELRRAAQNARCGIVLPDYIKDPDNYYDGGEVTFTESYDDFKPVTMWFKLLANGGEGVTSRLLYILSQITAEGDATEFDTVTSRGDWLEDGSYSRGDWITYLVDGGKYIYISEDETAGNLPTDRAFWRPYAVTQTAGTSLTLTVISVPPRLWELRATEDGTTITYSINAPRNAGHSVAFTSTNPPPGFDDAMLAALGDVMTLTDGRLVAGSGGEVTFTVPLAGSGKHSLRLTDQQGSYIVIGDACVYLTKPVLRPLRSKYFGVNLAGGDFTPAQSPGTYGKHYVYPSQPESSDPVKQHQEMDYHKRKGMQIFRVPFKWERMQRDLFGPLYGEGSGSWSGSQDIRRIDELVDYAESIDIPVILDCHNYSGRKGKGKIAYDNPQVPVDAIIDLWVKLANRYANRNVWFDFMNEPIGTGQGSRRVAEWMQWTLNAVRSRTDALNMCLIEGHRYSSAQFWVSTGMGEALERFYDPARNFAFSPHNYVDDDAGGISGRCIAGSSRLASITNWARQKPGERRLFLGEIQGGDPAVSGQEACGPIMKQCYDFLRDNPEWLGVTIWGGGRFTGKTYWGRVDPLNYQTGADTGVMQQVLPYLTGSA